MKIFLTKELKQNTSVITSLLIMLLFIFFSGKVRDAAALSVSNCLNMVIPSIFPVTVISFFVAEIGFSVKIKHLTDRITKRLFGLSGMCLEGIILGLTGGYNTAVKCAVALKEAYPETEDQAKRIALLFTNPGISFSVLLVGATVTGSINAGLRLYSEAVLFNLFSAILYNKFEKLSPETKIHSGSLNISDAFISAVKSASSAIISVSFNIIFFSCVVTIISNIVPVKSITDMLSLISEVSTAVIYSGKHFPFFITAGVTAFGGICIFIQNLEDLRRLNIKPIHFLCVRLMHGIFTGTAELIYSLIFPDAVYSSAAFTVKISSSQSLAGTLSLIFLCVIYLTTVRRVKRVNITTNKVK